VKAKTILNDELLLELAYLRKPGNNKIGYHFVKVAIARKIEPKIHRFFIVKKYATKQKKAGKMSNLL